MQKKQKKKKKKKRKRGYAESKIICPVSTISTTLKIGLPKVFMKSFFFL